MGSDEKVESSASIDVQLREMKLAAPSSALVELRARSANGADSAEDVPPSAANAQIEVPANKAENAAISLFLFICQFLSKFLFLKRKFTFLSGPQALFLPCGVHPDRV